MGEQVMSTDYEKAAGLADALAKIMQRWDDEGDDDTTMQEALENDYDLARFPRLAGLCWRAAYRLDPEKL